MVRQPLRMQHSQKQIAVPAPQFGKLRRAQTGKKQHVARRVMAEQHTVAVIEGEKMGVPATQGACPAIKLSSWIRQVGGGGNPRGQLLSAMENHRTNGAEELARQS